MKNILSKLFYVLNYVLMFISFTLILIGILFTYSRLDKSLVGAITIFIPYILVVILMVVNLFNKKSNISNNLLFNLTGFLVFLTIIIIGLRAKFDTSILLYQKYKINYNPNFLADNLSTIRVLLYCLSASNALILIRSLFNEKQELSQNNNEVPQNIEVSQSNETKILPNMEPKENNTEEL